MFPVRGNPISFLVCWQEGSMRGELSQVTLRVPHHFLDNQRSVKELTDLSPDAPLKSDDIGSGAWRGLVAPKPATFVFAVGMALTILAAMTWAAAAHHKYPIYQPQLVLLY